MIAQDKVFDILKLATLIADELAQHDLALYCLVNFHWYNTFTPHLWHSITIQGHDPVFKFLSPSSRVKGKKARHARLNERRDHFLGCK